MSEEHSDPRAQEEAEEAQPEPGPPAAPHPVRQRGAARFIALWLGTLLVVVAGVALSPFWAPVLAPLLPWGSRPAG
ncbi:MAG: hypothetical protein J2P48_09515, partial [Alphaproteobacteria bacterium]|nr:hypothetical protein [Alphaproteobacteria bacterium]